MGSDWKSGKLGDFVDSCLGKMLDKNKNKGDYHPYLGNSNVRWGYFELDSLSEMKFESHEHEKYGLKKGDLIVCEGGEPGRCAIWKEDVPTMKIQKALHRIRPLDGLDSGYLFYWFLNSGKIGRLDPFFTGTTIKHLTGKALSQLPIDIPPMEHQKYSVNVLSCLDNKIELNKQTNQTLEQMAQTLFKSWFVDFDPVFDNLLAKANYQLANLPVDFPEELHPKAVTRLAALSARIPTQEHENERLASGNEIDNTALPHSDFPSEFEFNYQLGWVPLGWEVKTIDGLCNINPQSWTKKNAPESVKYIDLANAKNGAVGEVVEYIFEDAPSRARRMLQPHDTIIGVVRPANRSFAYINEDGLTGSTGFAVVRAKKEIYRAFSYLSLTNDDCIQEFTRIADGAAYPAIKPEDVAKANCVFSNDIILEKFEYIVGQLMEKIAANEKQIKSLTKLRDTLLPKLISGELPIPALEPRSHALRGNA